MASSSQPRGPASPAPAPGDAPVSVDEALLTLTAQLTTPQQLVIEGRVAKVRSYRNWHFVDFAGTDGTVTFLVPVAEAPPVEGEWLTIRGRLKADVSRFHGGLEVFLTGRILGRARVAATGGHVLERRHTPVPLATFLAREQGDIAALCTETGARDAENACRAAGQEWPCETVIANFGNKTEMIRAITEVGAEPGCAALALLRGGGEARSMEMWNDPEVVKALLAAGKPFYTALGHSTYVLLADRYADEAFDTPSAFGAVAGQVLGAEERRQRHLARLGSEQRDLAAELDRARAELVAAAARLASTRARTWMLALVAALLFIALLASMLR